MKNTSLEEKRGKQGHWRYWLLAIRPKTLPAAVGPIAVGTAVAAGNHYFAPFPALACLLGALLLQIGVNLANDYFDNKNKIDSEERLGPVRVTQSGLIPPGQVKLAMILSLTLAGLVFAYLALVGGLPIVLIGIASVLAALAYSGGPYPLASHGLGEVFVFIFFGLVAVGGTYYVQTAKLEPIALVAAVPPGLLITAIMVVNNLRDINTDKKAGKNTLAVKIGRENTIRTYRILLAFSYVVPILLALSNRVEAIVLLPLVTFPATISLSRKILQYQGRELNQLLGATAGLSLLHSLLFAAGLWLGLI